MFLSLKKDCPSGCLKNLMQDGSNLCYNNRLLVRIFHKDWRIMKVTILMDKKTCGSDGLLKSVRVYYRNYL